MQSMIFAAGLGTRLKPLTDRIPKALVKVGGKPLIEHTIETLKAAGSETIVVNVHHFSNQIIDYLQSKDFSIDIRISDETMQLLDTGGGIKKAASFFNPFLPILIHNVDILSNADLRSLYHHAIRLNKKSGVAALLLVSQRVTKRYLIFNESMRLMGWTNVETGEVKSPFEDIVHLKFDPPYKDKQPNTQHGYRLLAFSGIHTVSPTIFQAMKNYPEKFPIMDFYLKNAKEMNFMGYIKEDLKLMDVGKLDKLCEAEDFIRSGYNLPSSNS